MADEKEQSMAKRMPRQALMAGAAMALAFGAAGCIKLQAPDKPIEINLNVKISQEVRVKLDKPVEDLIAKNPDVF
jgi:hypothetical protein